MTENSKVKDDNAAQGTSQFDYGMNTSQFGGDGSSQFTGGGGEFGTSFGGTNAVSQIFKQGGLAEEDRKRRLMMGGAAAAAVVACAGILLWFSWGDMFGAAEDEFTYMEPAADTFQVPSFASETAVEDTASPFAEVPDVTMMPEPMPPTMPLEQPMMPASTGSARQYTYNEMDGGPVIQANPGARIEVARYSDFSDRYVLGTARDGSFRIPNPPPGVVYWREEGSGAINEIAIAPPASLSLSFSPPGSVSDGGSISWGSSGEAGHYRVEFSADASFSSLIAQVATSQTSAVVSGLGSGTYFVRVGGLNLHSGKWEFSRGHSIRLQ